MRIFVLLVLVLAGCAGPRTPRTPYWGPLTPQMEATLHWEWDGRDKVLLRAEPVGLTAATIEPLTGPILQNGSYRTTFRIRVPDGERNFTIIGICPDAQVVYLEVVR